MKDRASHSGQQTRARHFECSPPPFPRRRGLCLAALLWRYRPHSDHSLRRHKGRGRHHLLHRISLGCASQVLIVSGSPAFATLCPQSPIAFATSPKSGFFRFLYIGIKPADLCSISINPSLPLLKTTMLVGTFSRTTVNRSPSNTANPPSPAVQTTCRAGWHFRSPIADGIALATVPCSGLAKVRRLPKVSMLRSVQTNAVPSSAVDDASLAVVVDDLGHVVPEMVESVRSSPSPITGPSDSALRETSGSYYPLAAADAATMPHQCISFLAIARFQSKTNITSEIGLRKGLNEVSENPFVQHARPDMIIRVRGD